MKVVIEIDCGNAAFEPDPEMELSRLLSDLASAMRAGVSVNDLARSRIWDFNGNVVGTLSVVGEGPTS